MVKFKTKEKKKGIRQRSGCTFLLVIVVMLLFVIVGLLIRGTVIEKPLPTIAIIPTGTPTDDVPTVAVTASSVPTILPTPIVPPTSTPRAVGDWQLVYTQYNPQVGT